MQSVQIKGLVRFSYVSENGFYVARHGIEQARQYLYAPERLDLRFRFFERVCLPTLRFQTDRDFDIGVLVGHCLPDAARARLDDLLRDVTGARIISKPPLPHFQAAKEAFDELPGRPESTHTATIRLDDDDGLHKTAVARIRALAKQMLAARDSAAPFVIAFNRGIYVYMRNPLKLEERFERNPLSVGTTLVAPKSRPLNVFKRNHRRLAEFFDTYTDVARPMFVRSVHEDNLSGANAKGRLGTMAESDLVAMMERDFGLVADELARG